MMRSAAEISTIIPSVESSTRIEYSKIRRDGADRNSVDRISVAAEPMMARVFRKRAKSSTMKLPPKVVSLPAGSISSSAPVTTSSTTASALKSLVVASPPLRRSPTRTGVDEPGVPLAAIDAQHQQHHGADGEHQLRQHRQQLITCT